MTSHSAEARQPAESGPIHSFVVDSDTEVFNAGRAEARKEDGVARGPDSEAVWHRNEMLRSGRLWIRCQTCALVGG